MQQTTFDFIALLMRYWFIFLILFILYQVVNNAIQEFKFTKKNVENDVLHLYWLKMIECPDKRAIDNLVGLRRENFVGSKRNCEIYLPFEGVSKAHCLVYYKRDEFRIRDLKSSYGTYINGKDIKKKSIALRNDDVITIGIVSMRFVIESGGGKR